jgi:vancomycin resistance protein VanJ
MSYPSWWARRAGLMARATAWSVWLYLAMVVAVVLLLRIGGDRWWFPTVILFGPRWFFALPLLLLTPLSGFQRRCMLIPLLVAGLIVFGPLMGCCFPWASLTAPPGPTIRVLTCNLKGRCYDNQSLNELIRTAAPDVVALQGCWQEVHIDWPTGWHTCQQGEFVIASHFALHQTDLAACHDAASPWPSVEVLSCRVAAPQADFRLCTLHLQSPHMGIVQVLDRHTVLRPSASSTLEAEIDYRWQQAGEAAGWLHACGDPLVVVGDFNMPPDSAIYRSFWSDYANAFTTSGLGFGYTEWPKVRQIPFGIRIDHVLTSPGWQPLRCWVGPDVGSDHLPVIADLVWQRP